MTNEPNNRRAGQWILIGLFALFFAPLLIAVGWYALAPGYAPPASPNGQLIDPPQPLEPFSVRATGGKTLDLDGLRGRWHLIHVVGDRCDPACRERLYQTRQVRDALGDDRLRVVRLAIAAGGGGAPGLAAVRDQHPRLRIVDAARADGLLRQLPEQGSGPSVLLVDPLGNLMMRFPPGLAPNAMLDDLEKLLKLSRIG